MSTRPLDALTQLTHYVGRHGVRILDTFPISGLNRDPVVGRLVVSIHLPARAATDERTPVRIVGCDSGQRVTLVARGVGDTTGESQVTFRVGPDRMIDTAVHAPAAGDYDGVAPTGWRWATRAADTPDEPSDTTGSESSSADDGAGATDGGSDGADDDSGTANDHSGAVDGESFELAVEIGGERVATATTRRVPTAGGRGSDGRVGRAASGDGRAGGDAGTLRSERIADGEVTGRLVRPDDDRRRPGVVVLHGSNGEPATGVARALAGRGFAAFALRWFGGSAPTERLANVPLSVFDRAASLLRERATTDAVGVWGISKGGEVALGLAAYADWPAATVAVSPSAYAQPAPGGGATLARDGEPVASLSAPDAEPAADPVERTRQLLDATSPANTRAAAFPVERADGPVTALLGAADAVWAADRLTAPLAETDAERVVYPDAGHAILPPVHSTIGDTRGGTPAGNARAARDAWGRTLRTLAVV